MITHIDYTAIARQARKQSGTGIYQVKSDQRALDLGRFACKESPLIITAFSDRKNNPGVPDGFIYK